MATLIFDLWQGQEKGRGNATTRSIIEAEKKDLIALLLNNFTDSKGNVLSESTLNDYLNSSKLEKRSKNGVRIELEVPTKSF